jgi:hypothetical protein
LHTKKENNNILKLTNYTKTKCIQLKKKDKQKQNKQTKYKAKKKKLKKFGKKNTSIVG